MKKLRRQSIVKGVFFSGASKGLARILRFLLLTIILHKFGKSFETDSYFLIQSFTLLFLTLNDTIFNYTLIPVLAKEREKGGEEEAKKLASSAFAYLNIFFFLVSLALFLFAEPLASAMVPEGWSPGSVSFTALLIRIISPIPLLAGLGGVPAAIFYSHRSFLLPNVTFLFYAISSILSAILLADVLGVKCVPMGATFGVALQAVVLIAVLFRAGGFSFTLKKHRGLKGLVKLTVPRIIGRSLASLNLLVDKLLAATLFEGSITCLTTAFRLNQLPIALLIAPLGTTMPHVSELAAKGDFDKVREFVARITGLIAFIVLPVMTALFILRVPLIGLFFQHGKFTAADTAITADAFFYYNVGLLFMALNVLMLGAVFALRDARTPLFLGLAGSGLNLGLDLLFMQFLGLNGIALAKAVLALTNCAILFTVIQKKIGSIGWKKLFRDSLVRIAAAAALEGGAILLVMTKGPGLLGKNRFVLVPACLLAGAAVYLFSCALFRVREIREAAELISRKFSRRNGRNNSENALKKASSPEEAPFFEGTRHSRKGDD